MSLVSMENPDLAWDLDDFAHRERATDFVLQFEKTLCVYSPSVNQIYSSYNMFFPKDMDRRLVILPDPVAFHDTFNRIEHDAVTATGLHIVPGELISKPGLFLANVAEGRVLGSRKVPFETAVRTIVKKRPEEDPFLPVLAKGDLREFEESWPVLHLHRVNINKLPELSELDRKSLADVIREKLESLFVETRRRMAS